MKRRRSSLALLALAIAMTLTATMSAQAGLIIKPPYDVSITGDMAAGATIMATIELAIAEYREFLRDPITVNITFKEDATIDLAKSSSKIITTTYAAYHTAMIADRKSADDTTSLASLPAVVPMFATVAGSLPRPDRRNFVCGWPAKLI